MTRDGRPAMRPETRAAHAGADPATGGVVPPIQPATTYERRPDGTPVAGIEYTRAENPTYHHAERLLASLPSHCRLLTVTDGHPAALAWLGAVNGHRTRALGVEHFGQSGTIEELYHHYGIDVQGICAAAESFSSSRS